MDANRLNRRCAQVQAVKKEPTAIKPLTLYKISFRY